MSDTDRQTLSLAPVENIEDGVAPPWRCQECAKKNQYAVQRILEVVRGEGGKFYLLFEYLGYRYLEIKLESLLVDKNAELRPIENMQTPDPASACSTARGPFLRPCGMNNLSKT
jgi:hypothetical protein